MTTLTLNRRTTKIPASYWFRAVAVVAIFLGGWYLIASLRTTQLGEDVQSLKAYLLTMPLIFLASLGMFLGTKRAISYAVLLTAVTVFSAILWANVEESLVINVFSRTCSIKETVCPRLNEAIVYERAWPFEHHTISYSPTYGWIGND
jgi:hypothetical protein